MSILSQPHCVLRAQNSSVLFHWILAPSRKKGDQNSNEKPDRPLRYTGDKIGGGKSKSKNSIPTGKNSRYKFLLTGSKERKGSVIILMAESRMANLFGVVCISDRIIFFGIKTRQGHLYHHIRLCSPVWPHRCQKGKFMTWAGAACEWQWRCRCRCRCAYTYANTWAVQEM